jgi:hypothetical protein
LISLDRANHAVYSLVSIDWWRWEMKKYPWDEKKEIDFTKPVSDIAEQYRLRSIDMTDKLIDEYFLRKILGLLALTGWILCVLLLIVMGVTK